MNFIKIGLLLREALDRLRVRLNMYLVLLRKPSLSDHIIAGVDGGDKLLIFVAESIQGEQNCPDAVLKHVLH